MKEELLEPFLRKIRITKIRKYMPKNCILCDIGCGFNAKFLLNISDYISKGYGFDKKIDNKRINNIYIQNAEISDNIPLEDKFVDCVTLLAVLEHLDYAIKVLSECFRILKFGGVLILTTPSPFSKPILEFLSFKLKIVSPDEIADHKHYYSKEELVKILEGVGFKNIETCSFEFGLNNLAIAFKGDGT
jgi:ubiquinone/menaquinone biosynthesis C-methylase UbiE